MVAAVSVEEVAFAAVAFAAVGDPYNQSVYQGSAGYTDQLVGQIQLRPARGRLLLWFDRPTRRSTSRFFSKTGE
jgi:hypothetical protein